MSMEQRNEPTTRRFRGDGMKALKCGSCGAPLKGNACEYCGTRYGDVKHSEVDFSTITDKESDTVQQTIKQHNDLWVEMMKKCARNTSFQ